MKNENSNFEAEEEDRVGELPNIKSKVFLPKQSLTEEEVVEVRENVTTFKAPDGGYGWAIVAISFFLMSLVDGFIYSYGAFYFAVMEKFETSIMQVMLGGFMLVGFSCGSGPFVASLANKFGFKIIIIVGSVSFFISLCGSVFCTSIATFNIVVGCFGGISLGFVVLPAYTVFSAWFEKHRAIACSLSLGGSGFGCIIYPLVIDSLLDIYGIQGCMVLLGAFNLNQIVLAMLLRDPMTLVNNAINRRNSQSKHNNFMSTDIMMALSQNFVMSHNSVFSNPIAGTTGTLANPPIHSILSVRTNKNSPSKSSRSINHENGENKSHLSNTNVAIITDTEADFVPDDIPCIEQSAYIAIINKALHTDQDPKIPVITEENFITSMMTIHEHVDTEDVNKIKNVISQEITRPFVRQDVFLPSSNWNIASKCQDRGSLSSLNRDNAMTGNIVITKRDVESPILGVLSRIFQVELFKMPTFILIIMSSLLTSCVTLSTPQSMKQYASYIQMSRSHSSNFISVYGIGLLASKPILGVLSNYIRYSEVSYFVTALILAIFTATVGFVANAYYIITFGGILAFATSNMTNLRSLLIAEYMPPNLITGAFGWSLLMSGMSMIIAPFIALIGSYFGLYNVAFIVGAIVIFISGLLTMSMLIISGRKRSKSRRSSSSENPDS